MSILPRLRNTSPRLRNTSPRLLSAAPQASDEAAAEPTSFPYVDTPDFAYEQWLKYLDGQGLPIGNVTKVASTPRVAVIGGGASGLCAAYELVRAGCQVDLFEAGSQVGGRCGSTPFSTDPSGTDLAELGAMRFPPSEFTLDYYLKRFGLVGAGGIADLPAFPDPGVVNTLVSYGGVQQLWTSSDQTPCPEGFETVFKGWVAFINNGLNDQQGNRVLQSASTITQALEAGDVATATAYWQQYLDAFGQMSFYSGLNEIFTGTGRYQVPGGKAWSFNDFDRFGSLGLGSGGFGPLYPIAFNEIFRLIPNEFETAQRFFKPGIRQLPLAFNAALAQESRFTLRLNTPVTQVTPVQQQGARVFTLMANGNEPFTGYDRVIVATTTRAMEVSLNLTRSGRPELPALVSQGVADGIMRTHVTASNKLAARINKYWANNPTAPRCLIGDNILHQVYTIDYGDPATAVCFLTYSWDDDAVKQQSLASDPGQFYKYLLGVLRSAGGLSAQLAENLIPLDNDYTNNVMFMGWQLQPYFSGAFKLSEPGQDEYVRQMFYDFQKSLSPEQDTGVYVAGDCVHWTAGWVEGALQAGLNAAAGVLQSLGGSVNTNADSQSPLTLDPNRFHYFNDSPAAGEASGKKSADGRSRGSGAA
jgi:tryptophan 2-monooxygenase